MTEWFYGKEGQQYGPIDEATLRARISTGEIGSSDLIWCEGMEIWTPLQDLPQFAQDSQAAPAESLAVSGEVPASEGQSPYDPPVSAPMAGAPQAGPALPGTNGLSIASLVCGILALIFFCFCGGLFFGVPAVICGHMSLNQLNDPANNQNGRGMAMAGLICGYIGIAVFLLMMLGNIGSASMNRF